MLSTSDTLFATIVPILISGVLFFLFRNRFWGAAVALGVAYAISFGGVEGFQHVAMPQTASQWLSIAAIAITLLAILDAIVAPHAALRAAMILIVIGGIVGFILKFKFTNGVWTAPTGTVYLAVIGIVAAIVALSWTPARLEATTTAYLAMAMVIGIGGLCVMILADQTVGAGMGGAASATLPIVVVSFLAVRRGKEVAGLRGLSTVFGGVIVVSLATAVFVSDVPMLVASLIVAAPVVFWLSRFVPAGRMRPWQHAAIRLVLTAIPVGLALAYSINKAVKDNAASDQYGAIIYPADTSAVS